MAWELITEPIPVWPDKPTSPRSDPRFKASYTDTITVLSRELDFLKAKGRVVMQVVTRNGAQDLRRDGLLRAQAKIEHPGVRISFESKHGPLTYATDTFESYYASQIPSWQANLRAIALGLEALRKVDRYGIARSGEQYRGWQALPPAHTGSAPQMSEDVAKRVLKEQGNYQPGQIPNPTWRDVFRAARANTHPDRHNGDRTLWDAVEQAAKVLQLI